MKTVDEHLDGIEEVGRLLSRASLENDDAVYENGLRELQDRCRALLSAFPEGSDPAFDRVRKAYEKLIPHAGRILDRSIFAPTAECPEPDAPAILHGIPIALPIMRCGYIKAKDDIAEETRKSSLI